MCVCVCACRVQPQCFESTDASLNHEKLIFWINIYWLKTLNNFLLFVPKLLCLERLVSKIYCGPDVQCVVEKTQRQIKKISSLI